jgi:hypothetical protein
MGRLNLRFLITIILVGMASVLSADAFAKVAVAPFARLSCENGVTYPIMAKAVSAQGDLVTGYIIIPRKQSIYIRLMPMEHGYRYAGRGIWLDGVRRVAEITGGKNQSLACTVEFE